jgi:hypothetical protein
MQPAICVVVPLSLMPQGQPQPICSSTFGNGTSTRIAGRCTTLAATISDVPVAGFIQVFRFSAATVSGGVCVPASHACQNLGQAARTLIHQSTCAILAGWVLVAGLTLGRQRSDGLGAGHLHLQLAPADLQTDTWQITPYCLALCASWLTSCIEVLVSTKVWPAVR